MCAQLRVFFFSLHSQWSSTVQRALGCWWNSNDESETVKNLRRIDALGEIYALLKYIKAPPCADPPYCNHPRIIHIISNDNLTETESKKTRCGDAGKVSISNSIFKWKSLKPFLFSHPAKNLTWFADKKKSQEKNMRNSFEFSLKLREQAQVSPNNNFIYVCTYSHMASSSKHRKIDSPTKFFCEQRKKC